VTGAGVGVSVGLDVGLGASVSVGKGVALGVGTSVSVGRGTIVGRLRFPAAQPARVSRKKIKIDVPGFNIIFALYPAP